MMMLFPLWAMGHQDHTPNRNVEITDEGVIVTYEFHGGIHQQAPLYPNAKFWKIPGFRLNDVAGEPSYPMRWDTFTIPDGATVSIEILDSVFSDTTFVLSPAYPPLEDSDTISYTTNVVCAINAYTGFFPRSLTALGEFQDYRGQKLVHVGIMPVHYDMVNHKVRTYSRIQYKLKFVQANGSKARKAVSSVGTGASFIGASDCFIQNVALNCPVQLETNRRKAAAQTALTSQEDNRAYLIVTTNKFLNAVNKFAKWKRIKGFRVSIESRNQWSDTTAVKNVITQHYLQDSIQYLLIVGDIEYVPSYIRNNRHVHCTDLYYGCMGGADDHTPDICRGRISVKTNAEAEIVFNKIIKYEKNPVTDNDFYNWGLHCAYFQDETVVAFDTLTNEIIYKQRSDGYEDRRFTLTSEEIRNYMTAKKQKYIERVYAATYNVPPHYWNNGDFSFGEEIPAELRSNDFNWHGTANDINDYINNRSFYVLYRGHGSETSWSSIPYSNGNISLLSHQDYYPVVFSITCKTGKFNYTGGNCFAETFLKKSGGGCVGIFAATESSLSGYNDILVERMFDSVWPDTILRIQMKNDSDTIKSIAMPQYELGRILDQGMEYMEEIGLEGIFGDDNEANSLYTRELFHCFGDPSMMMYTETPSPFYSPIINYVNGNIVVQTYGTRTDNRITFYTPSNSKVDSYVGNYKEYSTNADSVIICVDRHNCIPYIYTFYKNLYVQNETIQGKHTYVGETIHVGTNVTSTKPTGDVIIQNANVKFEGGTVILQPNTTISNSKVEINSH